MYQETIKQLSKEIIKRGKNNGRSEKDLEEFILDFLEEKESMELLLDPFFYKFLINEIDIALNE